MNHANSIKVWVSSLVISETDLWPGGYIMSWWGAPRLQLSQERGERRESGLNSQSWGPLAETWLCTTLPRSYKLGETLSNIQHWHLTLASHHHGILHQSDPVAYSLFIPLQPVEVEEVEVYPTSGLPGLAANNVRSPAELSNNTLNWSWKWGPTIAIYGLQCSSTE